jgi:CheY-like chemotaxis protein
MDNPKHILLVEDNVFNQKVAQRLLEKMGHQIALATNGQEALDAVTQHPYSIVLMDIQMPEMDGLEATRRIRAAGDTAHQPWIIAMTGQVSDEDRDLCLAAGMNDYISKPLQPAKLSEALARSGKG